MSFKLRSLSPNRISSQIAAIILISLAAIHVVLTAAFVFRSRDDRRERPDPPGQVATLAQLLDRASPSARSELAAQIERAFPRLQLRLASGDAAKGPFDEHDPRLYGLRRHLDPELRAGLASSPSAAANQVVVRLRDGALVTARFPPPPAWRPDPLIATVLFIAISLTLLGWWAGRTLIMPLRAFAKAAEGFSPEGEVALLPERGPDEIRSAAQALNRMRERVKALVEDRTRMLAAVGHDLRTPITRLRLRSEFIEDGALRAQTLADLDQMSAMIESLLVFLREGRSQKEPVNVDIAAIALTVCDKFTDLGHEVAYAGPDRAAIYGYPSDLERAIGNLIDNAVRYGGRAQVRVAANDAGVVIEIEDEGPGITDKQNMLQPFVRGEAARSMDGTSGFGLGLSIAHAIISAHHGTLAMLNREPRGLLVRIALPAASVRQS